MAGRPCLVVYTKTQYNSYFEGEVPSILRPKGAILHACSEDDKGIFDASTGRFCRFILSDARLSDLTQYLSSWQQTIDWTPTLNAPGDYTLNVHVTNPGTSGAGNLLSNQISDFVAKWGGIIDLVNSTANNILVNITGFAALKSPGFFDMDSITSVVFTQNSFDGVTYNINADYSALINIAPATPGNVERKLNNLGATVISNLANVVNFTLPLATIVAAFKKDIQFASRKVMQERYAAPTASVDSAVAAGGDLVITLAQLQTQIIDQSA